MEEDEYSDEEDEDEEDDFDDMEGLDMLEDIQDSEGVTVNLNILIGNDGNINIKNA
jgi:hypothetical protein